MSDVGYRAPGPALGAVHRGGAAAARPRARSWRLWALAAAAVYVAAVHAVVVAAVTRDDFGLRVRRNLGLDPATQEFDRGFRWWASALARSDKRARPGAVLFLGDSIMRDLDTSSIARHTINLAIPGDTTARLLRRMEGYGSVLTARGVVLGVGVNDLTWRSVPEALGNYGKLLALVPQATPVLAVAVLPVDERAGAGMRNADIRRLNEGIAGLCAARPGCHLVDVTSRLADGGGNLSAHAHEGDGLHLSAAGHELYWRAVNAAVLAFVPEFVPTPPAE